jgi:hypothetical protein
MADDTFLKRWEKQVRAIPELNNLHQPGIGRSYPLPAATESGRIEIRHFYHAASQTQGNSLFLGAPTMCAVVDQHSGELVRVFPATELGVPAFEDTLYTLSNEQKAAIRPRLERLRLMYDLILTQYPYQPGGAIAQEFWTTFQGIVPPLLLPTYRALSTDFVAWCTT